jgi:hypothetical protein
MILCLVSIVTCLVDKKTERSWGHWRCVQVTMIPDQNSTPKETTSIYQIHILAGLNGQ